MNKTSYKIWSIIGNISFLLPFVAVVLKRITDCDAQAVTIFVCIDMIIYIISFFLVSHHLYYGQASERMKMQMFFSNIYKHKNAEENGKRQNDIRK